MFPGYPLTRLVPFFPGQMGVPGSDVSLGLRTVPQSKVLYVDVNHPDASDAHDGTDPDHPLATVQEAVDKLEHNYDMIVVRSMGAESVVTPDYTDTFSYVTIIGAGTSRYAPAWESAAAATPCLDLRAVGWRIQGFRFYGPTQAACIELHHTDLTGNDIAIRTIIEDCYFDGLTTGRYGILSHGCYDVWVVNCTFSLFHNAVAGGAVAMIVTTTPLAIPYRNHIVGCKFYDNDNHVIWPCNGSFVYGCMFQPVGYAYAATQVLNTSIVGNPGDDNVVFGNCMPGDYSIAGGYRPGAADAWLGNWADDVAEAEVGDNGITIARPT